MAKEPSDVPGKTSSARKILHNRLYKGRPERIAARDQCRELTMAASLVLDRLSGLSPDDRAGFFEAARLWANATSDEDREAARRALLEIL